MSCQVLDQVAEVDRQFANLQSLEELYDQIHPLEVESRSDHLIAYYDAARAHSEDRLDMLFNGLSFVSADSLQGASLQLLACNSDPQIKFPTRTKPYIPEYLRQLERTRAAAFSKIHDIRGACRAHIVLGNSDERWLSGPYSPNAPNILSELLRQVCRSDPFLSGSFNFTPLPKPREIGRVIDKFQGLVSRARKITDSLRWGENTEASEALFFVEETLASLEDYISYLFEVLSFEENARYLPRQTMAAANLFFETRPMSDSERQARLFERLHHLQTRSQSARSETGNVVPLFKPAFLFSDRPWNTAALDCLNREIYGSTASIVPSLSSTTRP